MISRRCYRRLRRPGRWARLDLDQPGASASSIATSMRAATRHSVEAWQDGALVGGLYGVRLGRAFFGESMFHTARDAEGGAGASGGAVEEGRLRAARHPVRHRPSEELRRHRGMPRRQYHRLLAQALEAGEGDFYRWPPGEAITGRSACSWSATHHRSGARRRAGPGWRRTSSRRTAAAPCHPAKSPISTKPVVFCCSVSGRV